MGSRGRRGGRGIQQFQYNNEEPITPTFLNVVRQTNQQQHPQQASATPGRHHHTTMMPAGYRQQPVKQQFAAYDVRLKHKQKNKSFEETQQAMSPQYQQLSPNQSQYKQQKYNNPYRKGNKQNRTVQGSQMFCSKCHRMYDLGYKTPLMLECSHMQCEDCLKLKVTPEGIETECVDCGFNVSIKIQIKSDFNLRDYFPVNYYVAGKLYYNCMADKNEFSGLQFIKTDTSGAVPSTTFHGYNSEKCTGCKVEATLHCIDCEEVYCNQCSDKLHKAAKGLMQHRISQFCIAQCFNHSGAPLEFNCLTCNENLCSYCVIEAHKNHEFKQITKLQATDVFTTNLENCKEMLRKMEATHKVVLQKVTKFEPKQIDANLEKTILKSFYEIHGKLQHIETNLLKEAARSSNASLESLCQVERELNQNIAAIKNIIQVGDNVLNQTKSSALQNVDLVMQRMINACKLPHSLKVVDDQPSETNKKSLFQFVDFTPDLESHFTLTKTAYKTFKLICTDDGMDSCSSSVVDVSDSSDASIITVGADSNKSKSVQIYAGNQEYKLRKFTKRNKGPVQETAKKSVEDILNEMPLISFNQNAMENVLVTNIVSPGKFHVQFVKHYKALQALQKKMEYLVDNLFVSTVTTPIENKMYLVKCLNGILNTWRRGIIKEVLILKQECTVYYVDYGSNDTVLFNDLRETTEDIEAISSFALECKLYDITAPPNQPWTEDDAILMSEMLSGGTVAMILKNTTASCYEVDLKVYSTTEEFCFCQALLFLGRAVRNNDEEEDCIIESPTSSLKDKTNISEKEKRVYIVDKLKKDKLLGKIMFVEDAVTVYIQDDACKEYFRTLHRFMNDYYKIPKNLSSGKVYSPRVGMPIAVRHEDKQEIGFCWSRGILVEVLRGVGKVVVRLVDIGRILTVSFEDIRIIPTKFLTYAIMAHKIRIVHVKYENKLQNQSGIDFLESVMDTVFKIHVHIDGDEPECVLFEAFGSFDLCINAQLVQNAGLTSTGIMSATLEWPHEESIPEDEVSVTSNLVRQSQGYIDDDDDADEETGDDCSALKLIPVKVIHVINPDAIYLHPIESKSFMTRLTQLDAKFQNYQSTHHFVKREEWKVGENCVAFNKSTKQYFRATIMKCLPDNCYDVLGLDFGKQMILKCDDMGELSEEFATLPPLSLKVSLYGVKPMGSQWSLMATDYIKDLILGKINVYMSVFKCGEASTTTNVVMWIKKTKEISALVRSKVINKNINKMICKAGLGKLCHDWDSIDQTFLSKSESNTTQDESDNEPVQFPQTLYQVPKGDKAWLPATSIVDDSFQGVATYIDEAGLVYFHYIQEEDALKNLEDNMFRKFMFAEPMKKFSLEVGDICTVRYHQNQKFYRGEVLGLNKTNEELRVRMVDYGNVEECKYNEVWDEVHYTHIPRLAKTIRIHGIDVNKITTSILDALHLLLVEKVIDVTIVQKATVKNSASADICQGRINVNMFLQDQIISPQSNKRILPALENSDDEDVVIEDVFRSLPATTTTSSPSGSASSMSSNKKQAKQANKISYEYIPLPTSEYFDVSIISILGTNRVVFELIVSQEDTSKFEDLQRDINARWSTQPRLTDVRENQVCIALYKADCTWYRAQTIKIDNEIYVHYVDFGNVELLAEAEIREMRPEWLELPVQQFLAILADFNLIIPDHILFVNAVKAHLAEYVETDKLATITCLEPLTIKLFNRETKELAYEDLITSHIIKPTQ